MSVYYGDIYITDPRCYICENYSMTNCTGYQYCFRGIIANYNAYWGFSFPISLFNGKREGDSVELNYHNGYSYTIKVTCAQLKYRNSAFGLFEEALYHLSYKDRFNRFPNINTTLQRLISYNTHVHYAKSLNLPVKLHYTTYEPILLIDYIHFNCIDINNLLKVFYYELFLFSTTFITGNK